MNRNSMHEVQFIHRWREFDRTGTDGESFTTVKQCTHCGNNQPILHLNSDRGPSLADLPKEEAAASIRYIGEQSRRITEALDDMFSELLNGTKYHTIDDLAG